MARLLIIKTGSTASEIALRYGDFEDWFSRELVLPGLEVETRNVARGQTLPAPDTVDGVLVTGSPAMVTDREIWSEACADWLRQAVQADRKVLGVCYGHHLLARALGGRVGFHPEGREIGTHGLSRRGEAADDALFGALPERFQAHLSHKQSVLELPPGAIHLVDGEFEPHQAFRWGQQSWGCQFHPEFSEEVMVAYVESLAGAMEEEGLKPAAIREQVAATPEATAVLHRFAQLVNGG